MRSVGIKTLKNNLSAYIKLASNGETVLVTDRDRVVAEITAPRAGRAESISDAVLADAVRNGWVTPPLMPRTTTPRLPVAPLRDLLNDLDDLRSDR